MKFRSEPVRPKRHLRSIEAASSGEAEERRFFDYPSDLNPEVRQALESLAQFLVADLSSMQLPRTGEEALAASLFLHSIGQPVPIDTEKVMQVAREWRKFDDALTPGRPITSRYSADSLKTIAEFVALQPDTRVLFQDIIDSQRTHISPQALSQASDYDRKRYLIPAMILFPEYKRDLRALQDSWAPEEVVLLRKTMKGGGGTPIQDSDFWRLLRDIIAAPNYLPEWRQVLGQFFAERKDSINFGVRPKRAGEQYFSGESTLVYEVLLGQLLNGLKFEIDPHGKASLEPARKAVAVNRPLPERAVA